MKNTSRVMFAVMLSNFAKTYGVMDPAKEFSATPTIEQKLMDKMVELSDFLQRINLIGVDEQEGEKVLGSVTGLIGKRTNTKENDRQTSELLTLDGQRYRCEKTEYDVHINYDTIDAWAKFKDLLARYQGYVREAIAHARIKTGFYGTQVAASTNSAANPLGEDLNIGWLQHLRAYKNSAQWLTEGGTANDILIGGGGDYVNLDALVFDILQLVNEVHRDGSDLVAIMGRELLAYDKTQLYAAQGSTPTEKERVESNAVTRTYGGLPAFSVPFFPPRGLLITSWDNLSIYYQTGSVRQKIEDNAKRDQIEHYTSLNDAYVVEDLEKAAGIEFANVKLWDGEAHV